MNNDRDYAKVDEMQRPEMEQRASRLVDRMNRCERRRADAIQRKLKRPLSLKERLAAGHVFNG